MGVTLLQDDARRLEAAAWLLRSLVRIRTENPPGDTREAVAFLAGLCEGMGWHVLRAGSGPRQNLLAWLGDGGPTFVLNAHLDTVGAGDLTAWTVPPFEGAVKEGRLYGRGAADNKAGVTAALLALSDLTRHPPAGVRAGVMLVADEETGGEHGTGMLVRDGYLERLNVRAALVCDGSGKDGGRWGVRVATKGSLHLEIVALGAAVHASRPHQGRNAVLAAAEALLRLAAGRSGDDRTLPGLTHALLGRSEMTPGTLIEGGTTANTVPASCRATVDCRLVPGVTVDDVVPRVGRIVADAAAMWGCRSTVDVRSYIPPVETDPESPLNRLAREAIARVTGQEAVVRGLPGANDARFLVQAGIPTVVGLSPSDAADSHSHGADESVALADVVAAGEIYASVIRLWASAEAG